MCRRRIFAPPYLLERDSLTVGVQKKFGTQARNRHTKLVIRAQHSVKFPAITQDDEHLSWGRGDALD